MSAFRKRTDGISNVPVKMKGIKSWIYGQNLISTGSNDLNKILNGGYILGSIGLLEEDILLNQKETLIKLSYAEATTFEQNVLIFSSKSRNSLHDFYSKSVSKIEIKAATAPQAVQPREQKGNLSQLQIAWQYKRYLAENKLVYNAPVESSYNNSYDLSKTEEVLLESSSSRVSLYSLEDISSTVLLEHEDKILINKDLTVFMNNILILIQNFIQKCKSENKVGRIFIENFMDYKWQYICSDIDLLYMFINDIKLFIRNSSCFLLITTAFQNQDNQLYKHNISNILRHNTDYCMSLEAWKDNIPPSEFEKTIGLFRLSRVASLMSFYTSLPTVYIYGVERNLRSIKISELHLPPADAVSSEDKKKFEQMNQIGIGCSGAYQF
ncbi:hypothetical protein WA158_004351 [Blastocystis sp. Blastoise]